jgi:hypothetical protein
MSEPGTRSCRGGRRETFKPTCGNRVPTDRSAITICDFFVSNRPSPFLVDGNHERDGAEIKVKGLGGYERWGRNAEV